MSSLSPISEIVMRNLAQLTKAPLLLINPPADNLSFELKQADIAAHFFTTDLITAKRLETNGADVSFGDTPANGCHPWSQAILCWPKAKAHAELLLTQTLPLLADGAELWLVGENRGGINSAAKVLKSLGYRCHKSDSARRCSLFFSNITSAAKSSSYQFQYFSVPFQQQSFDCASLPGVFNHGKLDAGTLLLLQTLEQSPPYQGRAVDIGCGAGVITTALHYHSPKLELTSCDVNAMALAATKQTAIHNGYQTTVVASDLLTNTEDQFDLVISNPPFHQGLATDYDISANLFKQAYARLNAAGELRIVANGFLPYAEQIVRIFGNCRVLSENRQFKVYSATKS
ncbi:methyltransferase domain-containing protein [Corallincola luteus]|uniref:Ribosomal RNA small subunit methyltransferase C n=1 Tax=Corallincola luteus TaxID=1775177 RepID=A0ABY2ANM7_9GAMM|nr:methyltransferase [Corallincola luteus]TCI04804.1 methyltransferase domain-containing protein [Corallincola luteus]